VSLRARLGRVEARPRRPAPEPPLWAHIVNDVKLRLLYVLVSMPVPLHEAIEALRDDPRLPTVVALADRMHPALAVGMAQLDVIADADVRGEAIEALPQPAAAVAAARDVLFGAHNSMPAPYGRTASGLPPVQYDLGTIEGAAAAVVDHRAYSMWNLGRDASQLWHDSHVDEALAWFVDRYGGDAPAVPPRLSMPSTT
jgi:hypothetical protein